MSKHETDLLRAYVDGELAAGDAQRVAAHLSQCIECSSLLAVLESQALSVAKTLETLDAPEDVVQPAHALARFKATEAIAATSKDQTVVRRSLWENVTRSIDMMTRNALNRRWRPLAIGATAVLVLAILFSIAPVRDAAADFLGLFRIRKFAVIPLDQTQMDRLESLARQAEGVFAEPQIVREEGPEQAVSDQGQASSLAGYNVRVPTRLPEGAALTEFKTQAGPAMHFEFDRATLETVLAAAGAATDGLPQTEKIAFDVDVATMVYQQYRFGGQSLELIQAPSPQVNLPEGIDPIALAKTGFIFLGMPEEDAERVANSIDWTSTLVIPLPANAASAREVSVDGVTGLMLENLESERRQDNAVLWERDGILYFLSGSNLDEKVLLDAADSLQ